MSQSNMQGQNDNNLAESNNLGQIRSQWKVAEDAVLAHNMQQGEFVKKIDRNKEERRTARQDVPLARNIHSEEEAKVQYDRMQYLNRQRELHRWLLEFNTVQIYDDIAERDASLARRTQESEQKIIQRPEEDAIIAWKMQQKELLKQSEKKYHLEQQDMLLAQKMQEKEEQRYQQKLLEKQMERERRKQEKQLGNQQELLGERQKVETSENYNKTAVSNNNYVVFENNGRNERERKRLSMQPDDEALARMLQDEENKRVQAAERDREQREEAVKRDEELARAMQEKINAKRHRRRDNKDNAEANVAAGAKDNNIIPPSSKPPDQVNRRSQSAGRHKDRRSWSGQVDTSRDNRLNEFLNDVIAFSPSKTNADPITNSEVNLTTKSSAEFNAQAPPVYIQSENNLYRHHLPPDDAYIARAKGGMPQVKHVRAESSPGGMRKDSRNDLNKFQQPSFPTQQASVHGGISIALSSAANQPQGDPNGLMLPNGELHLQISPNSRQQSKPLPTANDRGTLLRKQYEMQLKQFQEHEKRNEMKTELSTSAPVTKPFLETNLDQFNIIEGQSHVEYNAEAISSRTRANDEAKPAMHRYQNCIQIVRGDTVSNKETIGYQLSDTDAAKWTTRQNSCELAQSNIIFPTPGENFNPSPGQNYISASDAHLFKNGPGQIKQMKSSGVSYPARDIYAVAPGDNFQSQPLPVQQNGQLSSVNRQSYPVVQQPFSQSHQQVILPQPQSRALLHDQVAQQLEKQQFVKQHHGWQEQPQLNQFAMPVQYEPSLQQQQQQQYDPFNSRSPQAHPPQQNQRQQNEQSPPEASVHYQRHRRQQSFPETSRSRKNELNNASQQQANIVSETQPAVGRSDQYALHAVRQTQQQQMSLLATNYGEQSSPGKLQFEKVEQPQQQRRRSAQLAAEQRAKKQQDLISFLEQTIEPSPDGSTQLLSSTTVSQPSGFPNEDFNVPLTVYVQGERRSVALTNFDNLSPPQNPAPPSSLAMVGRPLPQHPVGSRYNDHEGHDNRQPYNNGHVVETQRRRSKSSQPRPTSLVEKTPGDMGELADGFGHRGRDRSSLRASTGRHKNVITAIDPTYNEQTLQTYVPVADSQEAGILQSDSHHYADVNDMKTFAAVQGQKRSSGKSNKKGCRQQ